MLYIINHSPYHDDNLLNALRFAQPGNAFVLIADAVTAACTGNPISEAITYAMQNSNVYVLQDDLDARGIDAVLIEGMRMIDYTAFVDLTLKHQHCVSW